MTAGVEEVVVEWEGGRVGELLVGGTVDGGQVYGT